MAKKKRDLEQLQPVAASADEQLKELYETLSKVVTATGTLNEELSEIPTPQYVQEIVSDLARLRAELRRFVDPEWELPDSRNLQESAEAASTLAAELARAKRSWDQLPSDEEIKSKIGLLAQLDG